MANALTRFLGDSPLRVAIKLLILSFVAGFVMHYVGWRPWDVFDAFVLFFESLWYNAWDLLAGSFNYLLPGAAVVVPLFLVMRLLSFRSPRA